MVFENTAQRAT